MTISRNLSILADGVNASGVLNVASGGTGLTTFTAANNALYSTSSSALVAGTLPVLAGGTGVTTSTGTGAGVHATSPTLSNITSSGTTIITGDIYLNGSSTSQITIGSSQTTTGFIELGSLNGTGRLTLGYTTKTATTSIQAGATASGSTKTIDFGTGGLAGSTTTITIGSTAGTSTTLLNGTVSLASALAVGNGGTGLTTGTSGGIPYYSSTSALASSGLLTQYGVIYGGGAGATPVATAAGTTGQVLTATTGGAPTWSAVPSTVAVTSITFGSTGLTPATATTGAVTVAGTLAVTNGGTGVTTSTGTGNTVLSNSPTLVTPALGTPSSGVVTNLTGTASININGTVGATTPATGTFTTLSDSIGDVRTIVQNAQSGAGSYTLVATDAGKHIYVTGAGGVTMPISIFTVGQAITIVNNTSSSITITAPSAGTMYLAGTATTGNRTLALRGIATVLYVVAGATPTIIASGAGLT